MQQGKRMTTATLNVYNPIHLSRGGSWSRVAKLSAGHVDKAAKLFTFVRFHPHKHAPRAGDEHVPRVENTTSIARRYRSWALTNRESVSWADTQVKRRA